MTLTDQGGDVGVGIADRRSANGVAVAHVGTGAERSAAAGQDYGAHRGVSLRPVHAPIELRRQPTAPCVHALGPVESDHRDATVTRVVEHGARQIGDGLGDGHCANLTYSDAVSTGSMDILYTYQ